MIKSERVKSIIVCTILALWIAIPTGINLKFAIVLSNTVFRMNTWVSLILCVILVPLITDGKVKKNFDKLYLLFLLYCCINTIFKLFSVEKSLSVAVDAILILTLPYILVKAFSSIKIPLYKDYVINFIKLLGGYIVLQVFLSSLIAEIRDWDSSAISDRASSTLGESNCTAYFLVGICLLLLTLYIKKRRSMDLVQLLVTVVAILLSQSRGALGCLIIIFATAFVMSNVKIKSKMIILIIAGLVGIYFWNPDIYANLYMRIFTEQSQGSNLSRIQYLSHALNAFVEKPILGYGNGLLIYRLSRSERYLTDIPNPHNQWVALLVETGAVGVLLFVMSQVSYIKRGVRKGWESRFTSVSLFFYIIIGFMFETLYTGDIRTSLCFWLYWFIIEYFDDSQYNIK